MINLRYALLTLALGIGSSVVMVGQGYYDDDIYYDAKQEQKERQEKASKKKKSATKSTRTVTTTTTRTTTTTVPAASQQYHFGNSSTQPFHYEVVDLAGADAYNVNSGSTRDVDEYNRRYSTPGASDGSYSTPDETEDFTYTRRIEKFHNPTIVTDSGDDDLVDYYYNSTSSQPATVNIYVNNGYYDPWWGYSTWRYPSWYWNSWYGPSWSLSWNSAWGWNVGWNWGWGPAWYPAPIWRPYPYYGYHGYWRPTPPGSRRPHYGAGRPHYNRPGGYRPGSRPSVSGNHRPTGTRPGASNLGRPSGERPGSGIGQRPGSGNGGQVVRPGTGLNNGSVYRPGNGSVSRPRHDC